MWKMLCRTLPKSNRTMQIVNSHVKLYVCMIHQTWEPWLTMKCLKTSFLKSNSNCIHQTSKYSSRKLITLISICCLLDVMWRITKNIECKMYSIICGHNLLVLRLRQRYFRMLERFVRTKQSKWIWHDSTTNHAKIKFIRYWICWLERQSTNENVTCLFVGRLCCVVLHRYKYCWEFIVLVWSEDFFQAETAVHRNLQPGKENSERFPCYGNFF